MLLMRRIVEAWCDRLAYRVGERVPWRLECRLVFWVWLLGSMLAACLSPVSIGHGMLRKGQRIRGLASATDLAQNRLGKKRRPTRLSATIEERNAFAVP